jgi:hypothetical protein
MAASSCDFAFALEIISVAAHLPTKTTAGPNVPQWTLSGSG